LRIAGWIVLLALLKPDEVRARSWSYHYAPRTPQPAPSATPTMAAAAGAERPPAALLIKRAIVSDLAIVVRKSPSESERAEHSKYEVSQLLRFDPMDLPQALGVLASLSGYYLGARAELVYRCLTLRKGKTIEPLLAEAARNGNHECARELGQEFTSPSSALDGRVLCRSRQDQAAFLADLIAEIDSGKTCSNDELAAIGQ